MYWLQRQRPTLIIHSMFDWLIYCRFMNIAWYLFASVWTSERVKGTVQPKICRYSSQKHTKTFAGKLKKGYEIKNLTCVLCNCWFPGERGAGLCEHLRSEHNEHGEGSWLQAGWGAWRSVGKLQVHRLLLVCCRPEIQGAQSHSRRWEYPSIKYIW